MACALLVCCCCIDWQRDANGARAAAGHLGVVRVVAEASCRSRGCERSIVRAARGVRGEIGAVVDRPGRLPGPETSQDVLEGR